MLQGRNISKRYGDKVLFDNIDFSMSANDKIGIIGINGTGKSTLLKILAGIEQGDSGTITTVNNLKIGYLPQAPEFDKEMPILKAVLEEVAPEDIFDKEPEAKRMLNILAITDFNQKAGELSGGQRKRAALVRTFLSDADLYILDEPTNHLDSAMAEWLEGYLQKMKSGLIMITHDRYFLDTVVNRIAELDHGKLYFYEDSYVGYLALREQRKAMEDATERKRQSVLRTEIQWMMRGARARSTKQKAHIERYENLRDVEPPNRDIEKGLEELSKQMGKTISSRMGNTTIELMNINKAYGDRTLIKDFSYKFLKHDRVGIIGSNGCGKSTLLKMINGFVEPDSGSITIGQTITIGYFSQENEWMDGRMRVIDYVREAAEIIHTTEGTITASQMLERFLFTGDMQYSYIEKLSGGEKRRLYLLRLLMMSTNVLFLDEPTNDLDIQTLMILEEFLDHYDGIVVTVSHDRYFLDRVARRIFAFGDNGVINQYEGGYSDFLQKTGGLGNSVNEKRDNTKNSESDSLKGWKEAPKKLKMTFKEQKEFETIESDIEALEEKIAAVAEDMKHDTANYGRLMELSAKKEALETELMEKMERWEYLTDLAERIAAQ